MTIKLYDESHPISPAYKKELVDFLYLHLGEYGDALTAIEKAIDYATKVRSAFGGFILVASEAGQIVGATVINKTGMEEYIPENILVYIATHKEMRGKGIGKELMQTAINACNGNIALHVEPDNPAKGLYQKLGFKQKYVEMRLKRT